MRHRRMFARMLRGVVDDRWIMGHRGAIAMGRMNCCNWIVDGADLARFREGRWKAPGYRVRRANRQYSSGLEISDLVIRQ